MTPRRWGAARVVAVHQPNFFPWLGWFYKLANADVFVLLDDAQFSRGSWTNRSRILVNGTPAWMTVPVVRAGRSGEEIREVRINESTPWRDKLCKTLENNYRRAPAFADLYPLVEELVSNPADGLAVYNESALRAIAEHLGLDSGRLARSSELDVPGRATARLVELVRRVEGDTYLSGGGAAGYQVDEEFEAAGIRVVRSDFEPRPYDQRSPEFVPGLSIVDVLLNCGFRGTASLLDSPG